MEVFQSSNKINLVCGASKWDQVLDYKKLPSRCKLCHKTRHILKNFPIKQSTYKHTKKNFGYHMVSTPNPTFLAHHIKFPFKLKNMEVAFLFLSTHSSQGFNLLVGWFLWSINWSLSLSIQVWRLRIPQVVVQIFHKDGSWSHGEWWLFWYFVAMYYGLIPERGIIGETIWQDIRYFLIYLAHRG